MLRVVLTAVTIGVITVTLIPVQWLSVRLRLPSRRAIPTIYHRMICALLGVRIDEIGTRRPSHPLLVVANHSSWLDITVITEVSTWPLFGLLARLQRTVFVDRTRRHKTGEVNAEIAARLAGGDPVVLFAEGTSSDGNRVLPFRTALIGAARDALAKADHAEEVFIQPLSIAYTRLQGLPIGRQHRPMVSWYGEMDLIPHLGTILRHGAVDVTVTWGTPVAYTAAADRKEVAKLLESAVRRHTTGTLRGHSFLPQKPVRRVEDGGARREEGLSEAAQCLETRPQPERP
jgi:1-acyl-sn-glycerol-3-phosphate acyltransferase